MTYRLDAIVRRNDKLMPSRTSAVREDCIDARTAALVVEFVNEAAAAPALRFAHGDTLLDGVARVNTVGEHKSANTLADVVGGVAALENGGFDSAALLRGTHLHRAGSQAIGDALYLVYVKLDSELARDAACAQRAPGDDDETVTSFDEEMQEEENDQYWRNAMLERKEERGSGGGVKVVPFKNERELCFMHAAVNALLVLLGPAHDLAWRTDNDAESADTDSGFAALAAFVRENQISLAALAALDDESVRDLLSRKALPRSALPRVTAAALAAAGSGSGDVVEAFAQLANKSPAVRDALAFPMHWMIDDGRAASVAEVESTCQCGDASAHLRCYLPMLSDEIHGILRVDAQACSQGKSASLAQLLMLRLGSRAVQLCEQCGGAAWPLRREPVSSSVQCTRVCVVVSW